MIAQTAASLVLVVALLSGQALSSSVKGHSQLQQRPSEPAAVKSAQQQQQFIDRQPKSAPISQPILESSKKVYNDESLRRSAASQQQMSGSVVEPAVKSAAAPAEVVPQKPVVAEAPVAAPVPASAVAVPVAAVAAPVVAAVAPVSQEKPQPVEPVAAAPVVAKVAAPEEPMVAKKAEQAQVEPKSAIASGLEKPKEQVVAVKPAEKESAAVEQKEPLPAESVRSAPIKDEQPSRVVVEQVVPAKPVAAAAAPAPVEVAENKPVVAAPVEAKKPQVESTLEAKKDAAAAAEQPLKEPEPAPIEVPAPDPGLVLSEPIDSTTKLLIDLDEHVQKFLSAEDKQEPNQPPKDQVLVNGVDYSPAQTVEHPSGKSNAPLVPYSSSAVNEHEPIVPPLPQAIDKVEKAAGSSSAAAAAPASSTQQANTRQAGHHQNQNQQQVITQLLDQLDSLQNRIQDTINQLVARRRYVMSALLRPMGTYVRRVRTNLERLQNRVNQLQAAAVSVGGNQNGQRPGGFVDAAAIETIRRRIDDISKRISDIVNRIRFSLTPTSAPLNNNGRK